jgi:hypothetical protein
MSFNQVRQWVTKLADKKSTEDLPTDERRLSGLAIII